MEFDAFICYAIDDKDSVAVPLEKELITIDRNCRILHIPVSIIDIGNIKGLLQNGLLNVRFGIIILSESLLKIVSVNSELDSLLISQNMSGQKLILPVWHNVTPEIISQYSLALTDRLSATTDNGMDDVAAMIINVIIPAGSPEVENPDSGLRDGIDQLFLKQKYTLDLYRTWHSDMIRESRILVSAWVRQFTNSEMPSISLLRKSGDKIEKHISRLLFYYEQWAIFSRKDLIDKQLILKLLSSYLAWYHKIFIVPVKQANISDPEICATLTLIEDEVFLKEIYDFNDLRFN